MRCSGPVIVLGGEEGEGSRRKGGGALGPRRAAAGCARLPQRRKGAGAKGRGAAGAAGGGGRGRGSSPRLSIPRSEAEKRGEGLGSPPGLQASQAPIALRIKGVRRGRLRAPRDPVRNGSGSGSRLDRRFLRTWWLLLKERRIEEGRKEGKEGGREVVREKERERGKKELKGVRAYPRPVIFPPEQFCDSGVFHYDFFTDEKNSRG